MIMKYKGHTPDVLSSLIDREDDLKIAVFLWIDYRRAKQGYSQLQICKAAGISKNTYSRAKASPDKILMATLQALIMGLRLLSVEGPK